MPTPLTSIRLPRQLLMDLKALARKEAVHRGQDLSWPTLVRELIQDRLRREREQAAATR